MGLVYPAADMCGINPKTHYEWVKNDPNYRAAVEEITERAIDFAESKLFKKIASENLDAIKFFLRAKAKKRGYGNEQKEEYEDQPTVIINWQPPQT